MYHIFGFWVLSQFQFLSFYHRFRSSYLFSLHHKAFSTKIISISKTLFTSNLLITKLVCHGFLLLTISSSFTQQSSSSGSPSAVCDQVCSLYRSYVCLASFVLVMKWFSLVSSTVSPYLGCSVTLVWFGLVYYAWTLGMYAAASTYWWQNK